MFSFWRTFDPLLDSFMVTFGHVLEKVGYLFGELLIVFNSFTRTIGQFYGPFGQPRGLFGIF